MLHRPLIQRAGGFVPPIEQSLIFDGAAYLSWTPGSAGNRKTWTWAGWVRRSAFGTVQQIFGQGAGVSGGGLGAYFSSDTIRVYSGSADYFISTSVLRDPGWYHIAVVCDTSNATTADRIRVYQNGVRLTNGAGTMPALNTDTLFNQAVEHRISGTTGGSFLFSGAMTDIHFIDGTAITDIAGTFLQDWPFDGQSIPTPKVVTGLTYGTNGFHLAFADTAAFGDDTSGNGNDWTPTGFVAGDQSADVPGRPVAKYNPLYGAAAYPATFSEGGYRVSGASGTGKAGIAFPPATTGKFYAEMTVTAVGTPILCRAMVGGWDDLGASTLFSSGEFSPQTNNVMYFADGTRRLNNSDTASWGNTYTTNDVIGIAFDADTGEVWFAKNGVWQASGDPAAGTSPAATLTTGVPFYFGNHVFDSTWTANFGQVAFAYTPPTGFLPLSTDNFETPLHAGKNWFDANLRTGTGSTYSVTTGPANGTDKVWTKGRSGATDHAWYDIVRGVEQQLESNNANNETTETTGLTAFNSTGYTAGALAQMNTSAATYVDWMWKAGGAPVANTDGTISSTVSVADAGHFGIAGYTGNATAGATVGHGLPGAPELVIVKERANANGWIVGSNYLTSWGNTLRLDTTDAQTADAGAFNSTAPSSTVITLGNNNGTNRSGGTLIAYCFRSVPGLCKVGSYTGNGSADGPLIWLGFTPRWIMGKRVDSTGSWWMYDTARSTFNPPGNEELGANLSGAEPALGGGGFADFLGGMFKLRVTRADFNASGGTYAYLAIADIAGGGDLPWPLAR